ncbi:restriction endonuclease subunit S [Flavobacterium sp.]|uniref:restriction endonuclease subunit S n=1 Tax=Flavobacterium sp. TaxID=239 RepID=UPI0031DA11B1
MANKKLKVGNVPNLRFPGFEGEWEVTELSELGDFLGGGTPSSWNEDFWRGSIPWVSSSDLSESDIRSVNISRFVTEDAISNSATKLCQSPVILVVSRVGVGKVAYSEKVLCTSQDFLNIINFKCNGIFLSYLLSIEMKKAISTVQGTSIKGISSAEIKSKRLSIPQKDEQQKVASFISLIDERIETQNKIIKELNVLKTTITKRIFSRQLRFKDQDGNDFPEWKNMKLGDIGEVKMCRRIFNDETSLTGEIPFFKIGSFGKVADAFISQELYLDYRNRYSFPKKGDILISAAGTIGRIVVYKGEDAYYQDSNIVWIDNNNTIVINEFLYYILQIVKYNTEGGTIQRLYNNILKSTKFDCPTLPEQQKITNFLSSIDSKIDIENKLLQKLEEQKKFLLHQMFV